MEIWLEDKLQNLNGQNMLGHKPLGTKTAGGPILVFINTYAVDLPLRKMYNSSRIGEKKLNRFRCLYRCISPCEHQITRIYDPGITIQLVLNISAIFKHIEIKLALVWLITQT